jgi:xanthine dehydrogenase accessory factor
MIEIWRQALAAVCNKTPAVLVVVVDCSGSVPGKTGAMMVVSELGCAGTVGGGIAEKQLVDQAVTWSGGNELVRFDHTPDSGSLCAGSQTFAMVPLSTQHLPVLESIVSTLDNDGLGCLSVASSGIGFTTDQRAPRSFAQRDSGWRYEETIGKLETLYLVGGGHVSLALSRVMATLPFRIVVLDDREQLPTMISNTFAHETRVISYGRVSDEIPDQDLTYVVIMTYGHKDDETVLELLVGRSFHYLGLMGSPVKIRQIYANLESRGIAREHLERVHAPVGIPIRSHTPEEIAISIAAEIIKLRACSSFT